ncbi:MAG: apolipoprotein N-acyltransferase, partial [Rhodospirillaceae bacterium]
MSGAGGTTARLAAAVSGWTGWRRAAACFGFGALAVAAQPPLHFLPVLIVSFGGLVWLLDGTATRRQAFAVGWWFGAGYFAAGLYWVSNALLVDAARFGWMIPFAVLGLSFGLGLFIGAATWLSRLGRPSGVFRIFALAGAWTLLEWVRGAVLTGFPWNPVGNVWVAAPPVLQAASWIGVYGLSLVTVFAAAAPALLARPGLRPGLRPRLGAASGLVVLLVLAVAGAVRLSAPDPGVVPGVALRIVQANVDQAEKWRPETRAASFALHLRLSREGGLSR